MKAICIWRFVVVFVLVIALVLRYYIWCRFVYDHRHTQCAERLWWKNIYALADPSRAFSIPLQAEGYIYIYIYDVRDQPHIYTYWHTHTHTTQCMRSQINRGARTRNCPQHHSTATDFELIISATLGAASRELIAHQSQHTQTPREHEHAYIYYICIYIHISIPRKYWYNIALGGQLFIAIVRNLLYTVHCQRKSRFVHSIARNSGCAFV